MNVHRVPGSLRLLVSDREYVALYRCLNEIYNGPLIKYEEDFKRWIGADRCDVGKIFSVFPQDRAQGNSWGDFESGLQITKHQHGSLTIDLSDANFRVLRNCLFETCNNVRLCEFDTRVGIELEAALGMLRVMTAAVNRPN